MVEPPEECDPPDGAACDVFCRITTILPPGDGGGGRSPGNPGDALAPGTGGGGIPGGQIVRRFEPDGTVYSITFSAQGTKVAIGTSDNVGIWDVATGTELLSVQHDVLETPVRAVAFSPDGSQFLTGGGSVLGSATDAKLWDTNTGQLIRSFDHDSRVLTVTFSPQGALVMTGGEDEVAKLWNRATGELLNVFPHATSEPFGINSVNVVASPESTFPILTISDKFAALWDPPSAPVTYATGVTAATGHLDDIISGAISPDGRIIATGSVDDTAKLWDVATGLLLHTLPHSRSVRSIAFSPDGALLLTDAGWGTLWDVATGEKLHSFEADDSTKRASGVAFSQDGTHVLTAHDLDGAILWSVPNLLLGHGQPIPDASGTDGGPPTGGSAPGGQTLCDDQCDFCVVGTLFEGQCPVEFLDNGICECGCQFVDSDCDSSVEPTPTGHACCQEGGPGCSDPTVEACVCSVDSYCCNEAWDEQCVALVRAVGCDDCSGNGGVSPDVACGIGCDFCWTGTTFENQCPARFDGDNGCDCACQFEDSDCDAPSDSTPVCGNGVVEASEQCDPPGPACSDLCQSLTPQPSGAWFVINDSVTGDECDTVQFTAAQAVILVDGSRFMFIDGDDAMVDGLTLSPNAELISGGQVIGFVEFAVGGSGQNMAWALNLDGKVLNGTLSSSPLRPDQVTVIGSSACNACQQVDAPPAGRCP